MGRIRSLLALAAACLSLPLLLPASGLGAQNPVIADCNAHGQLTRHYTTQQLRTALNKMPPTIKEYTNCSDVINRALLAQVGSPGGGSAGGGSGGSFLPVWLIVVIVLLVLAGGGYAFVAYRRQQGPGTGTGPEPPPGD
jgi:hypothetical protein